MYFENNQFSEREKDVLKFLLRGKSNKQIALELGISNRTVEFHLSNIYTKLGVNSRLEAILKLSDSQLRESTDDYQVKSTVDNYGDSTENGLQPILRRIPMKKLYYIAAGALLATALTIVTIVSNPPTPTIDPTKTTLELEATSMSAFVTQQAATLIFDSSLLPYPTFTPYLSATPSPYLTFTPYLSPNAFPTSTSFPETILPFDQTANAYRIQFQPNATQSVIGGKVESGGEQRYVFSAMQGQTTSVWLEGYASLKFMRADGKLLSLPHCFDCTSNNKYINFWKGSLPATEDYFLVVGALPGDQAQSFRLYIAIAPPGVTTQTFDYQNKQYGFSLNYPDDFAPSTSTFDFGNTQSVLVLNFIDANYFSNTNLGQVKFAVGVSPDITLCNSSSTGAEVVKIDSIDVNSVSLTRISALGHAAGQLYEHFFHRVVHNNKCYEISFFIHSGNIGSYYGTGTVKFDHEAILGKLNSILSSFILE